jgi:hypothetical protein
MYSLHSKLLVILAFLCAFFFSREYVGELRIFVLRRKFVTTRVYRAHAHGFYIDKRL